jgi:hypothetical protein
VVTDAVGEIGAGAVELITLASAGWSSWMTLSSAPCQPAACRRPDCWYTGVQRGGSGN